jgi:hypothetical protein
MTGTLRAHALSLANQSREHGITASNLAQSSGEPVMRCADVLHSLAIAGLLVRNNSSYYRSETAKTLPVAQVVATGNTENTATLARKRNQTIEAQKRANEDAIFRSLRMNTRYEGALTTGLSEDFER